MIPFNKPYFTGNETSYIEHAVSSGKISGNGQFSQKCQAFFEEKYTFRKALLTTSCTDALEMCAILLNIQPGDEVIMPSFTFVSTANAFVLRGAKVVFADSKPCHPNIDETTLEGLITKKTKAIVVVHYAGVACEMDVIMAIAKKHNLFVVEDAAQAIDSFYNNKPLGSFGHLATFSFHETKNIQCGEGGLLVVNDERFLERAEIIWEKGTNRAAFFRGEVNKYGWVDIGSSFLPSELNAAFLWAQLENLKLIQNKRIAIWNYYHNAFKDIAELGKISIPNMTNAVTNNAHMFYVICSSLTERSALIEHLKTNGVHAVFHYLSLHKSTFYNNKHDGRVLHYSDQYSDRLLRLPLFCGLEEDELLKITQAVQSFYEK